MSAEDSVGTRRILVVEDEVLLALTLEDYLVAAGWTVVGPYSDLRTGMSAANRETFDVALLDVNLNGEMVFPLAEALLARRVPLVLLTGYSELNLPPHLRSVPRLAKPCEERTLVTFLDRIASDAPRSGAS